MRALRLLETSESDYPLKSLRIPEEMNTYLNLYTRTTCYEATIKSIHKWKSHGITRQWRGKTYDWKEHSYGVHTGQFAVHFLAGVCRQTNTDNEDIIRDGTFND